MSNKFNEPSADVRPFPPDPPDRGGYRSASGLVLFLTILLLIEMGLGVLLGGMSLVEATVFTEHIGDDEIVDTGVGMFYLGYFCFGILYLPVYLTCVVLFCVWAYRANRNARALGARQMTFTPGWSVGWFFIPVANLFKPFQAIREIHQASNPEAGPLDWKHSKVPPSLGWWWGFWIVTSILGNAEFRMSLSDDPDLMLAGAWLGVLSGILAIPLALLAIHVVRSIHARQELKSENPSHSAVRSVEHDVSSSQDAPAERAAGQLDECPWCGRSVVRTIDGRCPACDRPI